MTLLKELIEIPEHSGADDFVVKLTEARAHAEVTLNTYVPTPKVLERMETALGLVGNALGEGDGARRSSVAAYLHGSFGSGKSHFMAVMSLLLDGNPLALNKPALAPLVARYGWLGRRKVLVLGYHMLGAKSMEDRILGDYQRQVKAKNSEAPVISLYRSDPLLDMARRNRVDIGDAAFFERLGGKSDEGWGDLGAGWDSARFDGAMAADADDPERQLLEGALLGRVFPQMQEILSGGSQFVDFDEGLRRIAAHAKSLGYDAIVLCLDELILWFAQHATEHAFLNREIEKIVQLVESNQGDRAVPIVSFVARQRDLGELISTSVPNFTGSHYHQMLKMHEGKMAAVIELPDSDLAVIAGERLLKPVNESAKQRIKAAFDQLSAERGDVLDTLKAGQSMGSFQLVYPFTPAAIDVLVAAASLLQRDRTALKVMREVLVSHRDTLALESIIPLGDLFDKLSVGNQAIDDAFKVRFQRARQLWVERLAPAIEREYGLHPDEARPRAAEGDVRARAALGVSRVIKTLLLANVVESKRVLESMDIKRAVHLNHGSIRAPIPGGEVQQILAVLNKLRVEIPEIKVIDGTTPGNPSVAIVPTEHNLSVIVDSAAEFESVAAKVQTLRRLVFDALAIEEPEAQGSFRSEHGCDLEWRRTKRRYSVLFASVSQLADSELQNDEDHWRVVIDYPLPDAAQQGAVSDHERLDQFRRAGKSSRTVVWSPRTFGEGLQRDLGRLVRIKGLLKSDQNFERHTHSVQAADRESVRGLLREQHSALEARLGEALKSAYGLGAKAEGLIDDVDDDQVFQSLDPTYSPQLPVATSIREALSRVIERALEAQFPAHPNFGPGPVVARAVLNKVLECSRRAVADSLSRTEPASDERASMWDVARGLGMVKMTSRDGAAVLNTDVFDQLDRPRLVHASGEVTVGELRQALDQPQRRGLSQDMQDLMVLLYADVKRLRMVRFGQHVDDASIGKLSDEYVLRPQPLPSAEDWSRAVRVLNGVFGSGLGSVMTVHGFGRFNSDVERHRAETAKAVEELLQSLNEPSALRFITPVSARRAMATTARKMIAEMASADEVQRVGKIAAFADENLLALGKTIKSAPEVSQAIRTANWTMFQLIERLAEAYQPRASAILSRLAVDLSAHELDSPLATKLRAAIDEANLLLLEASAAQLPPPPPPQVPPVLPPVLGRTSRRVVASRSLVGASVSDVKSNVAELNKALSEHPNARVRIEWEVVEE